MTNKSQSKELRQYTGMIQSNGQVKFADIDLTYLVKTEMEFLIYRLMNQQK